MIKFTRDEYILCFSCPLEILVESIAEWPFLALIDFHKNKGKIIFLLYGLVYHLFAIPRTVSRKLNKMRKRINRLPNYGFAQGG